PVRSENQANKHAGPIEANHSAGTQDNIDAGNSEMEAESAQHYFEDQAFLDKLERLKRQEKDANDAAEALLQVGAARASSTNTVNTVSTLVSTARPSGGLSYTDLTNTNQNDSKIPALEDIYDNPNDGIFTNASYDNEGAVADFTNLETIGNVSPTPTSRIHSIHSLTQILEDPKNNHKEFQHCLFACFLSQIEPKKISEALGDESWVDAMQEELLQEEGIDYDEVFALVARIEAIRIFLAFASYMGSIVYQMDVKSAFLYGTIDEEVYVSQPPGFIDPKCPKKIYKVVKALYGLHQAPRACQDKYVAEILKKFDFTSVKTVSTPIETQKPLTKDEESVLVLGFRVSSFDLEAYSDSDYARANLDRKSTTGGCQFLGRRLISWQCKKQTIVATSTTEAEYVVVANCCGQFWNTATSKTVNSVKQIHAIVNDRAVVISESSVRNDLLFDDEMCYYFALYNDEIFENLALMRCEGSEQPRTQPTPFPTHPSTGDQPPVTDSSSSHETTQDSRDSLEDTNGSEGTQVQSSHDSPLSGDHTSEKAEGGLNLEELFVLCTNLSNRVLSLETSKDAQAVEILKLKDQIKKLKRKGGNAKPKPTLDAFDDLDADGRDYMETEDVVKERRQSNETEELNKGSGQMLMAARTPPTTTSILLMKIPPWYKTLIKMKEVKLRKKVKEEEASKAAIAEAYDEVQARINADALFAAKLQQE
ncbi:putative ribonuclease H-like domain-containing protein, partial [Tanacetum coccineum]